MRNADAGLMTGSAIRRHRVTPFLGDKLGIRALWILLLAFLAALSPGCRNPGQSSRLAADAVARGDMVSLGKNRQGFVEFLWLRDSSVVVGIPAGAFIMGTDERDFPYEGPGYEGPKHSPRLSEYFIDKYEVTNRQYRRFCTATGHRHPPDPEFPGLPDYFLRCPEYPVVNVSWIDAQAYAAWAGKALPTEAQWEKAARGTRGRAYPWGSEPPGRRLLGSFADESYLREQAGQPPLESLPGYDDGFPYTAPVGSFPEGVSPFGVLDMAGNAWEWCHDWYGGEYYRQSPDQDPSGPESGQKRVLRGGSWDSGAPGLYRCCSRFFGYPGSAAFDRRGFRCALNAEQLESGSRGSAPGE